jgi:hypothetical protein
MKNHGLIFHLLSPPPARKTGDSVYIMNEIIRPEEKFQFEALLSKPLNKLHSCRTWQCHSLPLPPYPLEQGYEAPSSPIVASAVVHNRVICVSALGLGTYCFDTVSRAWSHAGDWMLPFRGVAEHAPELNLWLGPSVYYGFLCTADLSAVVRASRRSRA